MKVQVTVKMTSKLANETTFRMTCKAGESVDNFKQRVCDVVSVPFPEQQLMLCGAQLSEAESMGESGVKDGSSLDFVVNASEKTLSKQLLELLPANPVSLDELESIYTLKCGASVGQALHMLGLGGTLEDFLRSKESSKNFVVSPAGFVQSAKAPVKELSQKAISKRLDKMELMEEEDLFLSSHKEQRMQKLEALLFCIQDLSKIEKEIEKITDRLDSDSGKASPKGSESPKKRAGKWFKKESSKHPGRFYYVNAETGESSWKKPADIAESTVKPVPFAPPPGLCLPSKQRLGSPSAVSTAPSLTACPEDSEMSFDDLKDVPCHW